MPKEMGAQRKDFGGRYGFPVFHMVLYPPPTWKVLARKVPQKMFFRWWSCTLFSSLLVNQNSGSNSGVRFFEPRILGPNSGVEFFARFSNKSIDLGGSGAVHGASVKGLVRNGDLHQGSQEAAKCRTILVRQRKDT